MNKYFILLCLIYLFPSFVYGEEYYSGCINAFIADKSSVYSYKLCTDGTVSEEKIYSFDNIKGINVKEPYYDVISKSRNRKEYLLTTIPGRIKKNKEINFQWEIQSPNGKYSVMGRSFDSNFLKKKDIFLKDISKNRILLESVNDNYEVEDVLWFSDSRHFLVLESKTKIRKNPLSLLGLLAGHAQTASDFYIRSVSVDDKEMPERVKILSGIEKYGSYLSENPVDIPN